MTTVARALTPLRLAAAVVGADPRLAAKPPRRLPRRDERLLEHVLAASSGRATRRDANR